MRVILTLTAEHSSCARRRFAQTWQPPADGQRCPSKWGDGDQRGSGQSHGARGRAQSGAAHQEGEVFELGRVLSESMPLQRGRRLRCDQAHEERSRHDHRASNEELVVAEIGQVGTQFAPSAPDDGSSSTTVSPLTRRPPDRIHQAGRGAGRRARHARCAPDIAARRECR